MTERCIPVTRQAPGLDPFRDISRLFDQSFGMPVIPEDFGAFPSSHWPGYSRWSPGDMINPFQLQMVPAWARLLSGQMDSGMSEIRQSPEKWKISLNVNHFSPEELHVQTKDGVLEITGKHEERADDHGFVSRHFTRKYTLPPGAEMEHMTSSLSPEGVLTVEAPLPKPAIKAPEATTIPINVQNGSVVKKD